MIGPRRATPVLRVGDYPRALAYWRDVLGFTVDEEGGDPPRFAIVFHVVDADLLHATLAAAGAHVARAPQTTVYGMREFELLDPDGNGLCFGADAPVPD